MKTERKNMQSSVQQTVDELFCENLIPFELTACKVSAEGFGEYVVPFHDSRFHSIRFHWKGEVPFKKVVRAAVLDRVGKMSGPAMLEWLTAVAPAGSA